MSSVRQASHAGSWYKNNGSELAQQLEAWLLNAGPAPSVSGVRAIISPHAGYYYCGECAAHAYRQIDPQNIERVFILGPAHRMRIAGCALTSASTYETPLGNLDIDLQVYDELMKTRLFKQISIEDDEDEHSLEMQLPYLAHVMQSRMGKFKIVPIVVGATTEIQEREYGQLLAPYLALPTSLFIISSDFCHWGSRFQYTYYDKSKGDIWQSIEQLDRLGMNIIESISPDDFSSYQKQYKNTICGRHPIGVLLNAITFLKHGSNSPSNNLAEKSVFRLQFLRYAQSSKCKSKSDSSVSYAAGVFTI